MFDHRHNSTGAEDIRPHSVCLTYNFEYSPNKAINRFRSFTSTSINVRSLPVKDLDCAAANRFAQTRKRYNQSNVPLHALPHMSDSPCSQLKQCVAYMYQTAESY